MGSLSPAMTPKLLLSPATYSDTTTKTPFNAPTNMTRLFKRSRPCVASANKNLISPIDFTHHDWKTNYEQDFEKRFNILHVTDFFPHAQSYPSTFCLRMRTPVSEDFAEGYPSDEAWHGYINSNDRVLLKI